MDNIFFLSCFLPLTLAVYWLVPGIKGKNAVLLVFSLLYTPCVAAISSIKRELGGKWAVGVVAGQCAIAWVAALIVRLIGLAFGVM